MTNPPNRVTLAGMELDVAPRKAAEPKRRGGESPRFEPARAPLGEGRRLRNLRSAAPGVGAWVLLGLLLSIQGYRSFDGDQAYRLPLLLHLQDPQLYSADPFVTALDAFNPHLGWLEILQAAAKPLGLPLALFALYVITFHLHYAGISRLSCARDGGAGPPGWAFVTVAFVLCAKAGNIGTNHLFEPMLLDRLFALGLGWLALGAMASDPEKGRRLCGPLVWLASFVHPSFGVQIGLLAVAGWSVWLIGGRRFGLTRSTAATGLMITLLALLPAFWAMPAQSRILFAGLPEGDFLALSARLQSPQHMLPSLWRAPQWTAWFAQMVLGCVLISKHLAGAAKGRDEGGSARAGVSENPGAFRAASLLAIVLAALAAAWVAIEVFHSARVTLFQPFRMATVARGLAIVFVAGHAIALWRRGDGVSRMRALALAAGLTGDWSAIIAISAELLALACERVRVSKRIVAAIWPAALALGSWHLFRHDTEQGQWRLLLALAAPLTTAGLRVGFAPRRKRLWLAIALAASWLLPVIACLSSSFPERWRFNETPKNDEERLAIWCREHTRRDSLFIGPPGMKTFRLWSRRAIAFNRSGSPYHAQGVADWARRFQEHTGFQGSLNAFIDAYLNDHRALERRYDAFDDVQLAELARRQKAQYAIASQPLTLSGASPLVLVHKEGRSALYRLRGED